MFRYLGIPTTTSANLIVRSPVAGIVTLRCAGQTITANADPAVDDGLVRLDVVGLRPDGRYSYTVTLPDGETATGILKTFPEPGIRPVKIGWFSCTKNTYAPGLYPLLKKNLDALICVGDEIYTEGDFTYSDFNLTSPTTDMTHATDPSVYASYYRLARSYVPIRQLIESVPYGVVHDDHEFAVNDIDWRLSQFQKAMPFVTSAADMQAVIDAGAQATWWYSKGNAPNTDSGVDNNPFYFRFRAGPAEVFVIACAVHGYDPSAADRLVRPDRTVAGGSHLGLKQKQWLLNSLANSDAPIKVIMSPKMTDEAEFSNSDGWNTTAWWDEFLEIGQAIHDAVGWKRPGGVIWCCGDFHSPGVHARYAGENGSTFDHVAVTACPSGQDQTGVRNSGNAGPYTRKWFNDGTGSGGVSSGYGHWLRNSGMLEITEEYVEASIILADGTIWWSGRVYAGSNAMSYPETKLAVS